MAFTKEGPKEWAADDAAARDTIGSDHGLQVGHTCTLTSDGTVHRCSAVTGAGSSTWTAVVDALTWGDVLTNGALSGGVNPEVSYGDILGFRGSSGSALRAEIEVTGADPNEVLEIRGLDNVPSLTSTLSLNTRTGGLTYDATVTLTAALALSLGATAATIAGLDTTVAPGGSVTVRAGDYSGAGTDNGGPLTVQGGGSSGASSTSDAGTMLVAGGDATGGGDGGHLTMRGGDSAALSAGGFTLSGGTGLQALGDSLIEGATVNANSPSGDVIVQGGRNTNGGFPGTVTIRGGYPETSDTNSRPGGNVLVHGGDGGTGGLTGPHPGGDLTLRGGHATSGQAGGDLFLFSGDGGGTGNSAAGDITMTAGTSTGTQAGGVTNIEAGNSTGSGAGGALNLRAGTSGSGTDGAITMWTGGSQVGTVTSAGDWLLGAATLSSAKVNILGGLSLFTSEADLTNKFAVIKTRPYTLTDGDWTMVQGDSTVSWNALKLGGDSTSDSATHVEFFTATAVNTSGTVRGGIFPTGAWVIGTNAEPFAGNALNVTGNSGRLLAYDVATNVTDKIARFGVAHYTNAEEPFFWAVPVSQVASNTLQLGGGSSLGNAATGISFWTAANNTTLTGTERGSINSAGAWTIGEDGGGQVHAINGTTALFREDSNNLDDKNFLFAGQPHTAADGSWYFLNYASTVSQNVVRIGGTPSVDSATDIDFYTATGVNTSGVFAGGINGNGLWTIGNPGNGQVHSLWGASITVSDVNTDLTNKSFQFRSQPHTNADGIWTYMSTFATAATNQLQLGGNTSQDSATDIFFHTAATVNAAGVVRGSINPSGGWVIGTDAGGQNHVLNGIGVIATDGTGATSDKSFSYLAYPHTIAQGTWAPLSTFANSSNNFLQLGGNTSQDSATQIQFYAATAVNTAGTGRGVLASSGQWWLGTTSQQFTGNALNIAGSDGRVVIYDVETDATQKLARVSVAHYTNAEEQVAILVADSDTTTSSLSLGGGTSAYNAVTQINFITAANNTTVTGTTRGFIESDGSWIIGSNQEPFNGNALNISGHSGALVGYDVETNATTKSFRIGVGHHTNASGVVAGMIVDSTASDNLVNIGGSWATWNAATQIRWYTAATSTTATGTVRGSIDSAGNWIIGQDNIAATHAIVADGTVFRDDSTDAVDKAFLFQGAPRTSAHGNWTFLSYAANASNNTLRVGGSTAQDSATLFEVYTATALNTAGTLALTVNSSQDVIVQNNINPDTTSTGSIGVAGTRWQHGYVDRISHGVQVATSGPVTIANHSIAQLDSTSGSFTASLDNAEEGLVQYIDATVGGNTLTLDRQIGDTINGAASSISLADGVYICFAIDATDWIVAGPLVRDTS